MTTSPITRPDRDVGRAPASAGLPAAAVARRLVGGFFLVMGGVHLGIVAAGAELYRHFADEALFGFVTSSWQDVVMARPELYGLLLMAGEVLLGTLLLAGGRAAEAGWAGVLAFHVLLMVFGFWVWVWSLPVLAVLVPLALRDRERGCLP